MQIFRVGSLGSLIVLRSAAGLNLGVIFPTKPCAPFQSCKMVHSCVIMKIFVEDIAFI